MWIFTKYGFFSAVAARQGDGGYHRPVDPSRVQVRARVRQHLEALRWRFPAELGPAEVLETRNSNYRYRMILSKETWEAVLTAIARELDYDNFKAAVADAASGGFVDEKYEHSLHDVWSVMARLQREGERSGRHGGRR